MNMNENKNPSLAKRTLLAVVGAESFVVAYAVESRTENWPVAVLFTLLGVLMTTKTLRFRGQLFSRNERRFLLYTASFTAAFTAILVVGTLHEIIGPDARFDWRTYSLQYIWAPVLVLDFLLPFYIYAVAKGTVGTEAYPTQIQSADQKSKNVSGVIRQYLPFLLFLLSFFLWTYNIQIIPIVGVTPVISALVGIYLGRHEIASFIRRMRSPPPERPQPIKINLILHCPQCGAELLTEAEFCPQCGMRLPPNSPSK